MKYIFSRKGFDSTAGGYPSLIFPDGTLYSIPIPGSNDKVFYSELNFGYEGDSIQSILNDVTEMKIYSGDWESCNYYEEKQQCHHDPMPINNDQFTGIAFGQAASAEGHLRNQSVDNGDIFLFYGWFMEVEKTEGVWSYQKNARDKHLIWSYMEVADSVYLDNNEQQTAALEKYPFLESHPHIVDQDGSKNRIYLSGKHKFFNYDKNKCLTDLKNYKNRSTWRLPACFHQPDAFSYLNNFSLEGDSTILSYRGYGQEFVLDEDKILVGSDQILIDRYIKHLISFS